MSATAEHSSNGIAHNSYGVAGPEPSRRMKEIVGLHDDGLKNNEIAEKLDITPGTVSVSLSQGLRRMGRRDGKDRPRQQQPADELRPTTEVLRMHRELLITRRDMIARAISAQEERVAMLNSELAIVDEFLANSPPADAAS
jgi:DNA-binding NarL/FixJ family response regulator